MNLIAYYRVSTQKQGRSGLGLEAQRATVEAYARNTGSVIVAEFTEIETGKGADALDQRPQLAAALKAGKKAKAHICVAKLDRLTRDVEFGASLMNKGVLFVACDHPNAPPLMLHILLSFAQEERRLISERTKAALAAAKARGVVLGNRRQAEDNRIAATLRAQALRPLLDELSGRSACAIAVALNARGIATPKGKPWSAKTVIRVQERLA